MMQAPRAVATAAIGVDLPMPTASTAVALISTILTSTSTSVPSYPTSSSYSPQASGSSDDEDDGECSLLGSFALIVQGALGALALLALVYKRWRERPQRPLKIWFFDVSKQVFGSVLVHVANIFMSMLTSGRFSIKLEPASTSRLLARASAPYVPNPCSFYLLNLAIDTTIGIPILILLLRGITYVVSFTPAGKPAESIQSGNYGRPPSAWWWFKQSIIYFCGLFGMKVCVLVIFLVMPWISKIGDWALKWTEGNEKLQIAFVMMIFPLIMNALQYYIIDSFIKGQDSDHVQLSDDDHDSADVRRGRFDQLGSSIDDDLNSDDEDGNGEGERRGVSKVLQGVKSMGAEEYDPDVDGEAPTVVGSSSSGRPLHHGRVVAPELFPNE